MDKFEIDDKQYFIKITPQITAEARKIHNRAFSEALANKALLRKALMKHMLEQGVWDDSKEALYKKYIKEIAELEFKLSSGGMKISEGRAVAIQLSKVRGEFRDLVAERSAMDANTAEGEADNARFNFLLVKCVHSYDTQKPVFSSVEEYIERGSDPLSMQLAAKFANFMYGVDENYEQNLVENKFLKRFNLINNEGRFIDKEGKFVDIDGHRIDEDGYRLDENGKRIDVNGHTLDVNVDTAEFVEG